MSERAEQAQHTFLGGRLGSALANALDVDLLGLTKLATVFALGDGAALLFDLEERPVKVLAGRGAVALYARFTMTGGERGRRWGRDDVGARTRRIFCC